MNPTTSTASLRLNAARESRADEKRRVHLDTYAKRRSQEAARTAALQPDRVRSAAIASIPMEVNEIPFVQAGRTVQQKAHSLKAISRRAILLSRSRNVLSSPHHTAKPQTPSSSYAPSVQQEQRLAANLEALYKPSLTDQLLHSNSKSASHVRTVVLSALTCGIVSLSAFMFLTRVDAQPVIAQPVGASVIEIEAPASSAPRGRAAQANSGVVASKPTDPVRLVISSIGVNAQIHGLGTTPDGLIAVPKAYGLVGWYNKGKTVSEAGPTVLVGHYAGGGGAVFDRLGSAKNGDLVTVTTKEGKNYTYKITKKAEYHKDKVPMQKVFASSDKSRLEIITCQGAWQGNTYQNRLVVTAELVR